MIGTNYGSYNYMNSVNSIYKYNYNKMTSQVSQANTAGVNKSNSGNYINSSAVSYMQDIKNNAKNLYESMDSLKQSTAFRMMAESSNNETLTVNASDRTNSAFKNTDVTVEQVASGQVNQGSALDSGERYGDAGYRQFEIEVNGTKSQFLVEVTNRDTNESVQRKMADAINRRNIGVTASVSNEDGSSSLTIQSRNTGDDANNRFTVRDVTGSLVSDTGANTISQQAQDAVYRINGGEARTSRSNDIDLGGGVTATLKQASKEPVTVTAASDTEYATSKVRDMVDSLNGLLSAAKSNNGGNNRLSRELTDTINSYSDSLNRIGINMGKDGKLSIDSEKLAKAAEDGSLESFFTQNRTGSYGFANRISNVSRNVDMNPVAFARENVNQTNTDNSSNNRWDSLSNSGNFNSSSFNSAMYSNFQNLGYLLNMFA